MILSEASLAHYEKLVNESPIYRELYPIRNMRAVMQEGMIIGCLKMGIQLVTGGACLIVPPYEADYKTTQNFPSIRVLHSRSDLKISWSLIRS